MFGIILAGGSGSRLWPLSRELYPKQLLNFNSENSLLQATFERLNHFMPAENIVSITNTKHIANVKMQLKELKGDKQVLSEPIARNTAPAIAIATKYLADKSEKDEDPVILVVPSDHLIKDNDKFFSTVKKGEELAKQGYINISDETLNDGFKVKRFVEKPDLETAKKYVDAKTYFWNSGIFMFKASVMFDELRKTSNEIFELMNEWNSKTGSIEYNLFEKMPNISVDYAVMEKSDKIALVKLESDWNDLGSWQAIYDTSKKDENNNVVIGHVLDEGSKNSFVYASSKLVATIGLEDTVVVETDDAILACKKDKTQDVKKIYEKLKQQNDSAHLVHKTVYRPWGFYTVIAQGKGFLTKIIHVNTAQKLSVQSHNHRSEHWVVLSGKAKVVLEGKEYILTPGHSIDIPLKAIHSLQNPFEEDLEIIEVQLGDLLIEEDIIRYEDIYGRV